MTKQNVFKVWFVSGGLDGCLPDMCFAYPTLESALGFARSEKEFELDNAAWGDYKCSVHGNIRQDHRYNVFHDGEYFRTISIEAWTITSEMSKEDWIDHFDYM